MRWAILTTFLLLTTRVIPAQADDRAGGLVVLRALIDGYQADRALIERRWDQPLSGLGLDRLELLIAIERERLEALDFERLDREGRVEWLLLRNLLDRDLCRLGHERERRAELEPLLPFAPALVDLLERWRALDFAEPRVTADLFESTRHEVERLRRSLPEVRAALSRRAAGSIDDLRRALERWFAFHRGYDPLMTWWAEKPLERLTDELRGYAGDLRNREGAGEDDLAGDPIGAAALADELRFEWIPYRPEELIAIAEREFAWCDREMARAARELGFDDWRAAQDAIKDHHVAPGEQPTMIRDLAREAIDFVEAHDLVSVPELCKEGWRMSMLSPEAQRISPYFLGGETIQVAFPRADMDQADKLMSLRGNNRHFARATVQHELIPGHHLQGYMTERHRPWRRAFRTPFWIEGWALYWEMRLWDLDFPRGPEDRIGMLFWRKHRCARIVFSLRYQLGTWSAADCVDYLVERVGHERNNAEAEVRRSIEGAYGSLYQAAYMLGGLQLRSLRAELVDSGRLTERAFHDAVLRRGPIPIELLRLELLPEAAGEGGPGRDHRSGWRFAGD